MISRWILGLQVFAQQSFYTSTFLKENHSPPDIPWPLLFKTNVQSSTPHFMNMFFQVFFGNYTIAIAEWKLQIGSL